MKTIHLFMLTPIHHLGKSAWVMFFSLFTAMAFAAPEISINNVSVAESVGNAVFTLTLSEASATPVTVNWATQDGTAIAPGDYTTSSGVVTFPANVLTRTISVPVLNDTEGELAETFSVVLDTPSANASIGSGTGVCTIQESDITTLLWDPGTAHLGTVVQAGTLSPVGRRYFKINAQAALAGGWRTALRVTAGEANLYASRTILPVPGSAEWSSERTGSDGWVMRADQFTEGETWYFLVDITTAATWRLYTGDVFVQNLGTLLFTDTNSNGAYNIGEPVTASGSGAVDIGPEGMRFFTQQAPSGTPAWSLWLNGDTRNLAVKQGSVPFHDPNTFDHLQAGAMLLVPPYLSSGSAFFFSVTGVPGQNVTLDSRIQFVTDVNFNTAQSNVSVTAAPFRTYRVQVPVNQIAWDVNTTAVTGNPNVAVRRDDVPSQWFNDGFSEVSGGATDSVTLVPQFLTNGTWFITVYGDSPYTFTLRNEPPTITPISYVNAASITNNLTNRVGWRFYSVADIPSQIGSLGWQLALAAQVPGTEIAIRRNAVPGRWNYRNAFEGSPQGNPGYVDLGSTTGLLQQPGHQADVWYVGIYMPSAPLGAFQLTTSAISPTTVTFNTGTNAVTGQTVSSFRWFRIDVPAGVLGWDVRVRSVTAGNPQLVVARDVLPGSVATLLPAPAGWNPSSYDTWLSAGTWAQSLDWTQRQANADETTASNRRFVAGIGRPLEPGTYYVGVFNGDTQNAAAYTIESRGIGTGQFYPVTTLNFAAGSNAAITNLAPREAKYFKVTVPANTPSWEITLDPTVGEMMLMARRGSIPDPEPLGVTQDPGAAGWDAREVRVQKESAERYVILPRDGQSALLAGDYYLAVVSEGQNPADGSHTGAGNASGTLTSRGSLAVTNLGIATAAGVGQAVTLVGAQMKAYRFTVASGTTTIEVRLNNRVGNPFVALVQGLSLPPGTGFVPGYGSEGGQTSGTPGWSYDDDLITIANPPVGDYSLTVSAGFDAGTGIWPASSADLLVQAVPPTAVAFNGGTAVVTNQQAQSWKYFRVDVPAGVLGWDVRVRDAIGGTPQMVVRRDLLPQTVGTGLANWSPSQSATWLSGDFWTQGNDWTQRATNADESTASSRRFVAGIGHPLEPGAYYVGVFNDHNSEAASYTVESRGIGSGQFYPVTTLNFTAGSNATITNLAPREPRYFKVTVPANTPSWEVTLDPTLGEMMLMVRRGFIPDPEPLGVTQDPGSTGYDAREVRVQKAGPERYVILPIDGQTSLVAGDYYLAVISEGQNPADDSHIGTGNSSGTLTSRGSLVVTNLGIATAAGVGQAVTLAGGQTKGFRVTVPTGTATLELRLNNRVGNPALAVVPGLLLPPGTGYLSINSYGSEGGRTSGTPDWSYDDDIITISNPPPGDYSLTVNANYDNSTQTFPSSSATLLVQAVPPTAVAFNGGTAVVTNQQAQSWKYFQVNVPAGVLGWDVRVRDAIGGTPQMVVRRDLLPQTVGTGLANWSPSQSATWLSGDFWTQQRDWTGRWKEPDETDMNYRRFVAGIGRPLEPGTYYVGVFNAHNSEAASYTVESRGIGIGQFYPVTTLNFTAGSSAAISNLAPREAKYFKVTVPANTPSWEVTLDPTVGEMMLMVRRGFIPDPEPIGVTQDPGSTIFDTREVRVQKGGPERYVILPTNGQSSLLAGDYYLAVISEGQNPADDSHIGTGNSSGTLTSRGSLAVTNLGIATAAGVGQAVTLAGGQTKGFRVTVPAGTATLELRLNNRVGNPSLAVVPGLLLPPGAGYLSINSYGSEGGRTSGTPDWSYDDDIITISNPPPGDYSLTVNATYDNSTQTFPPSSASLLVRQKPPTPLNFDAALNAGGGTNSDSQQIINGERVAYAVPVPATLNSAPVIGWIVKVTTIQGTAKLRIYKTAGDTSAQSMIESTDSTTVLVPPWLVPGQTWYAEVEGVGSTDFTITSSALTLNRNPYTMPTSFGQAVGDSGVQNNGTPLPGDQGIDLGRSDWHFYAVDVPAGNAGLLRTELQAISGNPDLYIREDGAPTIHHLANGSAASEVLYDRTLTGATTEYGNWVPLVGRTQTQLQPGRWYLGVRAAGTSNVRYRLKISTGTVTDLSLTQAPVTGQNLTGGDWRYYRFTVPANAPSQWQLTFSQQLGDVVMWMRDTVPPGDGTQSATLSAVDWSSDNKNQGPYLSYDPAGTHTLTTPPLRPGHTYFAGFRANGDATFTISSSTSGVIGTFPSVNFYNGIFDAVVPANGSTLIAVAAPAEATRWKHTATHAIGIEVRIEQGSLPLPAGSAHYSSFGLANSSLNQALTGWPWVPNQTYFIRFVNTTGGALPVHFVMSGKNALTEDDDNDGLPDAWEIAFFGNTGGQSADDDNDNDGLSNFLEWACGLDPAHSSSDQIPAAQRMGSAYVLTFTQPAGVSGVTYGAEWRPALDVGVWQPVADTGSGNVHIFSVPIAGNGSMFMRLKASSP